MSPPSCLGFWVLDVLCSWGSQPLKGTKPYIDLSKDLPFEWPNIQVQLMVN